MATTPKGLRYPTSQDLLADTPVYINNLKDDASRLLAKQPWVLRTGVGINTDASGFWSVSITDFATLRGACIIYAAAQSDVWTMYPLITSIGSQVLNGQMWFADRDQGAGAYPDVHAFANSGWWGAFIAWGDPR